MTLVKQTAEERILAAADRLEPAVRRTFLQAVDTLKQSISIGELADLLESDVDAAFAALQQISTDLAPMRDAFLDAMKRAFPDEIGFGFDLINERAVRWAQENAAKLVTSIDTETMTALRRIVVRGQREGINVRDQAKLIRDVVGLTVRDARMVDRVVTGMWEDGLKPSAVERQREQLTRRLLRRRAENIARTETIRASNMGNQLAWEQAIDNETLPASAQKVWIATEDARTCPICNDLDGMLVGVGDSFHTDVDGTLSRPVTEKTPPAHPSCRCTTGIVVDEGSQQATTPAEGPPILTDEQWAALDPDGFSRHFSADEAVQILNETDDGKLLLDTLDRWIEGDRKLVNIRNDIAKLLEEGAEAVTAGEKRAESMLRALRQSPYQSPDSLYRGMYLKGGNVEKLIADNFSTGSTVDMGLSSFTKQQKVANQFASWGANQSRGQWTQVVVEWTGNVKQSMPVRNAAGSAKAWRDHEWVGGGRFRVVDAQSRGGKIKVIMEQVEGL